MSEKLLALGGLLVVAIVGFGGAIYYAHRNGQSTLFLSKAFLITVCMGLGMFSFGFASDTWDGLVANAEENRKKDAIVVSVMPAGIVQGGMQTTDNALFFSNPYTSIETSKGVYRVSGSHIIQKGAEAEIQLRATGREYLCAAGNCMRLSSQ